MPTAIELDARGRRLRAALAAVLATDTAPALQLVREWLDSWTGLGLIIVERRTKARTSGLPPAWQRPDVQDRLRDLGQGFDDLLRG